MNHSASVLDAGEIKQDFLIEQFRIQDSPTALQIDEQLPSESSLGSAESIEAQADQFLIRLRAIGEEYLKRIQSSAIEFVDRVQQTVGSGPISKRHNSHIQLEIQDAENRFGGNVLDAEGQMKIQHEMLCEEMEGFKSRWSGEVFEKIIQTEAAVLNEDLRLQQMIEDPTVELGYLMRAYAANREMKAYLQGLKLSARAATE